MTVPSLGPTSPAPQPSGRASTPNSTPAADDAQGPTDKVTFYVDPDAPHRRLVIPPDGKPLDPHPVSGSKTARYVIAGSVVGVMSGGYVALAMLGANPIAAASVTLGSAVVGAVAGYLATRK